MDKQKKNNDNTELISMSKEIGKLQGQVDGVKETLEHHQGNFDKVFKHIDHSTETLRKEIHTIKQQPCRKEDILQTHTDAIETLRPVLEQYKKDKEAHKRSIYERTEIKIIVGAAIITWLGTAIAKGVHLIVSYF